MTGEVRRSSLCGRFPARTIHYGLDTDVFRPRNGAALREVLGVPRRARVVLFVADGSGNVRKGFGLLTRVLGTLRDVPDLFLLAVGGGAAGMPSGVPYKSLPKVDDDRFLSFAYSAADVFVIPSLAEAFGQTCLEAMACGTRRWGSRWAGSRT